MIAGLEQVQEFVASILICGFYILLSYLYELVSLFYLFTFAKSPSCSFSNVAPIATGSPPASIASTGTAAVWAAASPPPVTSASAALNHAALASSFCIHLSCVSNVVGFVPSS